MNPLSAKLFARSSYTRKDDLELLVEFTNDSGQSVYISKNIAGAFTEGALPNKAAKTKSKTAYYKIPPRTSVIKKVNLGKSFTDAAGMHELLFKLNALEPHYKKGSGNGTITRLRVKNTKLTVQIGKPAEGLLNGTVLKGRSGSNLLEATVDEDFQEPLLDTAEELFQGVEIAHPCAVNGGTPQQQDAVRRAHAQAFSIAVNGLARLRNDGTYRRWFGTPTPTRFDKVRDTLRRVIQDFQERTFTYDINTNTGGDVIANAVFGEMTIDLFRGFFNLLSGGLGGKASRVFHEHTHASGNTFDHAYDENECLSLANSTPDDAVENANSYRFFAES